MPATLTGELCSALPWDPHAVRRSMDPAPQRTAALLGLATPVAPPALVRAESSGTPLLDERLLATTPIGMARAGLSPSGTKSPSCEVP